MRATSADPPHPPPPLPVSTALEELDDWRLRPGEIPGRVWDSRIHGFDAGLRGGRAVIEGVVPGFDDDD